MFTGIIEATAKILDKTSRGFAIKRPNRFTDIKIGSSVCVSGACLSVVKLTKDSMVFDVVPETLKKSWLGTLKKGDMVNLERAMKAGDRLDGHIVQGHVEGVGKVESCKWMKESCLLTFYFPCPTGRRAFSIFHSVVPKGSIAIDGVSLTVAEVHEDKIKIAVIPHTLKHTTLGSLKKGDRVNIETDVMMRAIRPMRRFCCTHRKKAQGRQ